MIQKEVQSQKVKLTQINDINNYEGIFRRHLSFSNTGEEPRPVLVVYDDEHDIYLVFDGNKRVIGHKLSGSDVLVSILEESDGLNEEYGSMFRVGKAYQDYESILKYLREKFVYSQKVIKNKFDSGEIPEEVYVLLV